MYQHQVRQHSNTPAIKYATTQSTPTLLPLIERLLSYGLTLRDFSQTQTRIQSCLLLLPIKITGKKPINIILTFFHYYGCLILKF